jgi:hypothetical protein
VELLVQLVVATQELTRATNESTRTFEALREDIAKLKRNPQRYRRAARLSSLPSVVPAGQIAAAHEATVTSLGARHQK